MDSIKLIIADDHLLFRNGLSSLFGKHENLEVIATVGDGDELLEVIKNGLVPDIVLLDLTMKNLNGFEVLKWLKKNNSSIKAIIISMHDEGNYIKKCVRSGAYGYLLKNADEEELIEAIYSVYNGRKYYNQEISEKMINNMSVEGIDLKKLSNKESEILKLLSEGLTTKEIASKLFVSTRTIETHRSNMLTKLEVKNTAELIKKSTLLNLF